jgi:hypothetical protein
MIGFVIGNGESRKGFDLNKLVEYGPIFGCNALYRDFYPTTLIAVDDRMIKEINEYGGIPKSTELICRMNDKTRRTLVSSRGEVIVDRGYAAGPTALYIMCGRYTDITDIFLIGFDIYSKNGKVNNMYKDTNCYAMSDQTATYTKNWIERLCYIFSTNPSKRFYRVSDDELNKEYKVPSWVGLNNVYYINYEQLDKRLEVEKCNL